MVSSYQLSVSYKEYLSHRVFSIHSSRNNIFIFFMLICDFLSLSNFFHTLYQIPILSRFLKVQAFRSLIHFILKLSQDFFMIAVKKIQKAIYLLFIFFPGNIALT